MADDVVTLGLGGAAENDEIPLHVVTGLRRRDPEAQQWIYDKAYRRVLAASVRKIRDMSRDDVEDGVMSAFATVYRNPSLTRREATADLPGDVDTLVRFVRGV